MLERVRYPLGLNENPYGPLPSVRHALERAVLSTNRYPEMLPHGLSRLIADRIGCPPEQIVVGAGATGVIHYILQAFVTDTLPRVVLADPTFDGYPILVEAVGGHAIHIPLTSDGFHDVDAMVAAADDRTAVVVLCNPHNPTGTQLGPHELLGFLNRIDSRTVVLLDEAYIDFVDPELRMDAMTLLAAFPNVIVVRTFSKAFGLAGLRVGFAVADPRIAAHIAGRQIPFGMNALAEVGVAACYAAEDDLNALVYAITNERDRLSNALRRLGYALPVSSANHIFVPLSEPDLIHRIADAFASSGIRVRRYPTGMRITVGTRAANETVLACLAAARDEALDTSPEGQRFFPV
ncbi:pyridoxal phosphate-dependent aminotransferase [Nocardia yamanashiensis]|uniref:pyridoxal phosphate-dependent aminotransferase n=1 Tax=Nocardia yamanashiensis TaxID=209247 RepID=UPI0008333F93|nr:aminotransferase class I/II-fold pyridoxal phosphate-dependent enzyme [Nocardia yamanashiensis]